MTTLEEQVKGIIEGVSEDFHSLPEEERKRIAKYTSEMRILTIWQMLHKDDDLTTKRWKSMQRKWLENCVKRHLERWWYE